MLSSGYSLHPRGDTPSPLEKLSARIGSYVVFDKRPQLDDVGQTESYLVENCQQDKGRERTGEIAPAQKQKWHEDNEKE